MSKTKTDSDTLRVVSVSGGKDSTALYCWAIEQWGKDGFVAVFADTGHEHPVTLNYVRNLPDMAGGPGDDAREWATTSRGGRQQDMFAPDVADVPSCMSTWGACE